MPKAIPEGYNTLTPTLIVNGAAEAIELYKQAFGAKEIMRAEVPGGNGKIMHAALQVGSSRLFLADATPESGCSTPTQSNFYVYVENVDDTFAQAKKAGLTEKMAPQDMFYGDRIGALTDKFGTSWSIATHTRDVSEAEIREAMKKMCKAA